jgi:hypothetical protein
MKINGMAAVLAVASLAGCGGVPTGMVAGSAVLQVVPGVTDGPMLAAGQFGARAVVKNYTKANINHLTLKVFTVDGKGNETPAGASGGLSADLVGSSLAKTSGVKFAHLAANTRYRVRAFAYKASGVATADLISDPKSSLVDVTVGNDDRPTMATIPVKLIDVVFDGLATSSVSIVDGGYLPTPAATISFQ